MSPKVLKPLHLAKKLDGLDTNLPNLKKISTREYVEFLQMCANKLCE